MEIADFVGRLHKVRRLGKDKFMACCPAHDDKHPSLSITTTPTGKILLRCWTGCGAADVVQAMGLRLSDLFPTPLDYEPPMAFAQRERKRETERLAKIDRERMIVALSEADRRQGRPRTREDVARELRAVRFLIESGVEHDATIIYQAVMMEAEQWKRG